MSKKRKRDPEEISENTEGKQDPEAVRKKTFSYWDRKRMDEAKPLNIDRDDDEDFNSEGEK